MKITRNAIIPLILLCSASFLSFMPMFFQARDLWDGVVISHAFESGNREIYWNWFTESGWFLTPIMYDVFFNIFSDKTFLLAIQLTMITCHIISTIYIYKLSKLTFKCSDISAVFGALIFAFSPIWSIYYSTVFLMHSITLALALFCVEKIITCKDNKKLVFYYLLSFISYQQVSCAVLIITLLTANIMLNYRNRYELKIFFSYIIISSIYFISTRLMFPANGLYLGYNEIVIRNIFNESIWETFLNFINNVYPLFIILILALLVDKISNIKLIIISALMLIVNIIPFVLVGKPAWYSHLFGVQGWDQRQAITIVTALSLIFSAMSNNLISSNKIISRIGVVGILVYTFTYSLYQYYGSMLIKNKAIILQNGIEFSINKYQNEIGECGLIVKLNSPSNYNYFNNYELTYIANKVFGSYLYSKFDWENDPEIFEKKIYQDKYMLPSKKPSCMKTLEINSENIHMISGLSLIGDRVDVKFSSRIIYDN
ncbi:MULTISPECIES: hypothetical protein [Vibrio]|uniref:hypothetical protein n=1 Tax=Vibrio TaxID=662 RepID=UPI0014824D40|nr:MULTISPECIES: hypothetical protein [Vibrio]MDQ2164217.1 hypothetical protein [Vibrio anguillarum]NNN95621.1 hypothetical protein [Vibrio sp. B4-6]